MVGGIGLPRQKVPIQSPKGVRMDWRRVSLLLVIVLTSGLIAAGCGDDDDGDDDNAVSVPTELTVPTTVTDVEEAQKQATEAIQGAKSQAYEACINAANQLSEPQKSQSLQACEKIK
jgi:hypothetical protein